MDGADEFGQTSGGGGKKGGYGFNQSNGMNETRGGYGKPTKGEYNSTEGGFKTFGTEGQGEGKQGLKGNSEVCSQRQMYITVTATSDLSASDTILLEIGSYTFEDAPAEEESSVYLMTSIAILSVLMAWI